MCDAAEREASRTCSDAQQARVGRLDDDGTDALVGVVHDDIPAAPQLPVERHVRDIALVEARKPCQWQVCMFDRHGLAVGGSQAVDVDEMRTLVDPHLGGHRRGSGDDILRQHAGSGLQTTPSHVLGERCQSLGLGEARFGDKRPLAGGPGDQSSDHERLDCASDRHAGDIEPLRELPLGWQLRTRSQSGDDAFEDLLELYALRPVSR